MEGLTHPTGYLKSPHLFFTSKIEANWTFGHPRIHLLSGFTGKGNQRCTQYHSVIKCKQSALCNLLFIYAIYYPGVGSALCSSVLCTTLTSWHGGLQTEGGLWFPGTAPALPWGQHGGQYAASYWEIATGVVVVVVLVIIFSSVQRYDRRTNEYLIPTIKWYPKIFKIF